MGLLPTNPQACVRLRDCVSERECVCGRAWAFKRAADLCLMAPSVHRSKNITPGKKTSRPVAWTSTGTSNNTNWARDMCRYIRGCGVEDLRLLAGCGETRREVAEFVGRRWEMLLHKCIRLVGVTRPNLHNIRPESQLRRGQRTFGEKTAVHRVARCEVAESFGRRRQMLIPTYISFQTCWTRKETVKRPPISATFG